MTLLEDLAESGDVRSVDVEEAALRYHNRHPSKLSSGSLREYKTRLQRVLKEFATYNENPAGYRPRGRIARSNARKTATATDDRAGDHEQRRPKEHVVHALEGLALSSSIATATLGSVTGVPMLRLSYPIRDDVLAEIAVPRGMTNDEAKRLCAFITTLAKDFRPSE